MRTSKATPTKRPAILCIFAAISLTACLIYYFINSTDDSTSKLSPPSSLWSKTKKTTLSDSIEHNIRTLTSTSAIVVFSKTYCPYSKRVKALFKEIGVQIKVIELDVDSKGADIQDKLKNMTGMRTVPSVWIGGKFIGGYDDTERLKNEGRLMEKIKLAQQTTGR